MGGSGFCTISSPTSRQQVTKRTWLVKDFTPRRDKGERREDDAIAAALVH
jgi:hypothetical protein